MNSIITARVFASKHRTAPPHRDRGRGNTGALRRVFSASQPEGDDHVSKSAKALVAALVLAATSLTFVANASARPTGQSGWSQDGSESYLRDRRDPSNTNGF